jgi:hypothetical protein
MLDFCTTILVNLGNLILFIKAVGKYLRNKEVKCMQLLIFRSTEAFTG